jgi:hypothetical protein
MKKENPTSVFMPLLTITFGGLAVLGALYITYFGVYTLFEKTLFRGNTFMVPAGAIRNGFALVVLLLFILLLRTKISDVYKATFGVGALALPMIAVVLALYQRPVLAIAAVLVIAVSFVMLIHANKKPWFYYYSIGLAVLAALFYAWPR